MTAPATMAATATAAATTATAASRLLPRLLRPPPPTYGTSQISAATAITPTATLTQITAMFAFNATTALNPRTGYPRGTNAVESLIPSFTLATMVSIIKILVIMLTRLVCAPIGILSLKILPVMRILLIPRIPPWRIPVSGSNNIGGRISVIRGPSISIAEIVIQHSIQKPITVIKDPWRIGANPGCGVKVLGRGGISLTIRVLTIGGWRHWGGRASSQQNCHHKDKTQLFHTYLRKFILFPMISGVAYSLRRFPCFDPNAKVTLVKLTTKMVFISFFPRSLSTAVHNQG